MNLSKSLRLVFLGITIFVELIFIVRLTQKLFLNRNIIQEVSPINKDTLQISKESDTSNFYEPLPNTVISEDKEWLKKPVSYSITEDSLNESRDYQIPKENGVFRILTIGDSFTFGYLVNTADNYPEQLEKLANKKCNQKQIEIINLGVGGYDIDYSVKRYEKRGVKYNPDLVIWLINDWNYTKLNDYAISKSKELGEKPSDKCKENINDKNCNYSTWIEVEKQFINEFGYKKIYDVQVQNFSKIRELYDGPIIVSVFGDQLDAWKNPQSYGRKNDEPGFEKFIETIGELNDVYIFPEIKYSDLETLRNDSHPNESDYVRISNEIYNFIESKGFISCEKPNN